MRTSVPLAVIILVFSIATLDCFAQMDKEDVVDQKVISFLKKMQFKWRDMNVSQADGRQGSIDARLRYEIAGLAKAIYECGFRYTRDNKLKSHVVRQGLRLTIAVFSLVIFLSIALEVWQAAEHPALTKLLVALFGVSGGLLSATTRLRARTLRRSALSTERTGLYFRAVFGGIAAVIVNMFFELHLVDFPLLHSSTGDAGSLPDTALYVIGFASGFTERVFFGAISRVSPKGSDSDK